MRPPLISVLIDTYNHQDFIEAAVRSVLEQDFPKEALEVLVVDDGSTDRTPQILEKFLPAIRILRKNNGGQASAFNAAIPETRGEIVAFLDGDDWWAPAKLNAVAAAFAENPDIGVVGHGIIETDETAGEAAVLPDKAQRLTLRSLDDARLLRHLMCFFGTSRVAIRNSVLQRVLPIPTALVVEADEYMSTLAVAISGAVVLTEPLTYYRLHSGNLFQFRDGDESKVRRVYEVARALLEALPPRLASAGVQEDLIAALVESLANGVKACRLGLEGGARWETFHVEHTGFRLAYRSAGPGYRIFKGLVLLLSLLLPPRSFYKLRSWYSARGLRRFRQVLGEPVSSSPVLREAARPRQPFSRHPE